MKVFISSVVHGMEEFREVAATGARTLGHEVKRSDDFPASSATPQQACLAGVRWADVVILLLGNRYGQEQSSGLSATHEEYREAKERHPVLAFVQQGVDPEPEQQRFIEEVRTWQGGRMTNSFRGAADLQTAVIRSLHDLELSQRAGVVDEADLLARAQALIPNSQMVGSPTLTVAVAAGPRQPVLRPAELENPDLERKLLREALLGDNAILSTEEGTGTRIAGNALLIEQQSASVYLDDLGSVRVMQPARKRDDVGLPALIQEDIAERIGRAIRFAGWTLDQVDPVMRLTDVVPVVALNGASYMGWRTREEHLRSPNRMEMSMSAKDGAVILSPPRLPRAALLHDTDRPVLDFVSLLARRLKSR